MNHSSRLPAEIWRDTKGLRPNRICIDRRICGGRRRGCGAGYVAQHKQDILKGCQYVCGSGKPGQLGV